MPLKESLKSSKGEDLPINKVSADRCLTDDIWGFPGNQDVVWVDVICLYAHRCTGGPGHRGSSIWRQMEFRTMEIKDCQMLRSFILTKYLLVASFKRTLMLYVVVFFSVSKKNRFNLWKFFSLSFYMLVCICTASALVEYTTQQLKTLPLIRIKTHTRHFVLITAGSWELQISWLKSSVINGLQTTDKENSTSFFHAEAHPEIRFGEKWVNFNWVCQLDTCCVQLMWHLKWVEFWLES